MTMLLAGATARVLRSSAPACAMGCCGDGKGKGAMMCGKIGMGMERDSMKGRRAAAVKARAAAP